MKKAISLISAFAMSFQLINVTAAENQRTHYYSMDNLTEITYSGTYANESGQTNSAVNFSGGYAVLGENPLGEDFTFSAWIKPTDLTAWERVFDFGLDTSNYVFLTVNNGSSYPRFAVKGNGQSEQYVTASKSLIKDAWAYVTVTMDSGAVTMYIDGEACGSGTISIPMSSLSSTVNNYIAKSQYDADPNYRGCIDEIEIYNYAMSQTEINGRMSETAAAVQGFEQITKDIKIGEKPILPESITVTYTNGMTAKSSVEWDEINEYKISGEYEIMGTSKIAGKEYDVTAKINVISDSIDENYSVTRSLNFVKNTGVVFAEAIYNVYSEKSDELVLKLEAVTADGTTVKTAEIIPSADGVEASVQLDLKHYSGDVTLRSTLHKKSDNSPVTTTQERTITISGGFADSANVTLEKDSVFEKSEQVGLDYIMSIDVDRLLAPSYEMQGLTPPNNAQRYSGWERKGASNWGGSADTFTLAGHSLGHWMSAAAVFCRDTQNDEVLDKLNYAIAKLDELQKTTGSGYIGGCSEECFTRLFGGNSSSWADGYWVPWYGVHKIYQGLLDAYDYTGNTTAYTVLEKFSDWAVDGTENLTDAQMQEMLGVEYGGMNEIFARMYEITGEEKYLNAARRFTHDTILNPLINNTDSLTGLHANTQIPKIIGAAEIYEQDGTNYADYYNASKTFMNFVVNNRSYAIGGNSIGEHFEAQGAESLGIKTCESCNTYNMMRLAEHLFDWEHNSAYMDWYETALYNHILGQQDPDSGAKMYFVSLLQGHHRVYEIKEESWWCCTGTGMENPGRYTRCTYYEDGNELYVNLYMPGEYTWENKGISFKIETNYPYSENVKITVTDGSGDADIKLRAPSWLKSAMTAEVGGETYSSNGGEYMSISRSWNTGDVINITIPMQVRTYNSRAEKQIAYQYGPIVLAAEYGSLSGVSGVSEYISNETVIDSVTADVPYLVTNGADTDTLVSVKDADKLEFTINGENTSDGNEITLKPFYEIHHTFHNVYWNVDNTDGAYDKQLNDITIDKVEPDGQQDELGHGLNSKNSNNGSLTIGTKMYYWRDAWGSADAYFEYALGVNGDKKNYLFVRYYGSDGAFQSYVRDFNISVDGNVIANQTLNMEKPGDVYDVFYEIPEEYTAGKTSITVKFAPKDANSCAGGVLEIRTVDVDLTKDPSKTFDAVLSGNKITFTSEFDEAYECDMFTALYDADGVLLAVKMNLPNGEFELEKSGKYVVKAFFWNRMTSVYDSVSREFTY